VSDRNEVVERGSGAGSRAAGGAWSAAVSTTARLPEVGVWRLRLVQAVLGERRVSFDLVVVVSGG
jgi:hypothetical protein